MRSEYLKVCELLQTTFWDRTKRKLYFGTNIQYGSARFSNEPAVSTVLFNVSDCTEHGTSNNAVEPLSSLSQNGDQLANNT